MTWNPSLLALAGAILVAGFTMQPVPAPVVQMGRYVALASGYPYAVIDTASGASYRWNFQKNIWEATTYEVRNNMLQQLPVSR